MVNKNIVDVQNTKFIVTNTGFFGIDCTNPRAKLQIGDGISLSSNPILLQVANTLAVIKDGNKKRVGIGKYPEEDLDVDGNIQISSSGQEKITFFDTGHQHEHGKLLYADDGIGSKFEVFTKNATSGDVEQVFTINNQGALGLGTNPNFGTDGQVLMSKGTNTAIWGPSNKYYFYNSYYEPFGLGSLGGFSSMIGGDIYYVAFYTSVTVDYKKIIFYTSEDFTSFTGNLGVAIYSDSIIGPSNLLFKHKETYTSLPGVGSLELDLTLDETFSLQAHTKYWLAVAVDTTNFGTMGLAKALITDTDNVHIRKGTGYTTLSEFPSAAGFFFSESPLNFWFRLYNPDMTSFNQQTDSPDSLSIFKTNVDLLEAKIETESDVSGTGSALLLKTLDNTGVLTEKIRINKDGALGIDGSNFGNPGNLLTSNGSGSSVSWSTPPLSKVFGTTYFSGHDKPINAAVYNPVKDTGWTWTNFGSFTPANLFSVTQPQSTIRIPRPGNYNVTFKVGTTTHTGITEDFYYKLKYRQTSGTIVDIASSGITDNTGDFMRQNYSTISIVCEFEEGDELQGDVYIGGSNGNIRGDVPADILVTKMTYMSIHNVD